MCMHRRFKSIHQLHGNNHKEEVEVFSLKMKLVAEILTGSLFYVEVGEDATVADLKKEIGDQENLPSDRLILILDNDQGPILNQDEVPLKDYGVQDSSHIFIFFEPFGEGTHSSPSTPKEAAPEESSASADAPNEPLDQENQEAPNENQDAPNEPSDQGNQPSPSVDPSSDQKED